MWWPRWERKYVLTIIYSAKAAITKFSRGVEVIGGFLELSVSEDMGWVVEAFALGFIVLGDVATKKNARGCDIAISSVAAQNEEW